MHGKRFSAAIKTSGIKRVILLDDAFDVPELEDREYARLDRYLSTADGDFEVLGLNADLVARARDQISIREYTGDDLVEVAWRLHEQYILTRDGKFDPTGAFSDRKSENLADIDPLLSILRASKVEMKLVGVHTPMAANDHDQLPDLIFVDFYLDKDVTGGASPTTEVGQRARSASLDRLDSLLGPAKAAKKMPSVVLMSSKPVEAEAATYRKNIKGGEGHVYASRFGFIRKSDVSEVAPVEGDHPEKPKSFEVCRPAADVLLDIIQAHPFGQKLHDALKFWRESAAGAVVALGEEIEELTLKDFAYLVSFRLSQEGLSLFEYLEWFFGECLLGHISEKASDLIRRPTRAGLDKHADLVEGAYEGKTDKIAELYNRARIELPRNIKCDMRLGDLYVEKLVLGVSRRIWAVLNPDCDLIVRENGKRAAKRILTLGGELVSYEAPKSSLAEFIIVENVKYSISWDLKDLVTRETFDDLTYVGTMRPLYAQELQRRTLQDLSRVGLAVAPVLRMDGQIAVVLVGSDGKLKSVELGGANTVECEVLPGRGGSDVSRVLLRRSTAEDVVAAILSVDPETLSEDAKKNQKALSARGVQEKLRSALQGGAALHAELPAKVILTDDMTAAKGWCGIVVSMTVET